MEMKNYSSFFIILSGQWNIATAWLVEANVKRCIVERIFFKSFSNFMLIENVLSSGFTIIIIIIRAKSGTRLDQMNST